MLTNVLQRRRRSLDGPWHVIVDPYEMGYIGILGDRNDRGFFRDFTPRHRGDRVEYDFDRSPTLTVPGDWNTQDERLFFYEGTVWYRRRITVADDEWRGERQFLHVGAANHTSRVFVDGDELATHQGGFGPFAVELTGRLGPGEHSIVIQVDNRREPDRIPAMRSDWWNFGGLTRSVDIVDVPATFLRDAWITMDPSGRVIGGVVGRWRYQPARHAGPARARRLDRDRGWARRQVRARHRSRTLASGPTGAARRGVARSEPTRSPTRSGSARSPSTAPTSWSTVSRRS